MRNTSVSLITLAVAALLSLAPITFGQTTRPVSVEQRLARLEAENARLRALVQSLSDRLTKIEGQPVTAAAQRRADGELTREMAAELLNKHLAQPSISQLAFQKGGLERAARDGIVEQQGGFPPSYRFTRRGLQMFGDLVATSQNRIQLAPLGMEDPKFSLAKPIGERIDEVSGVAAGPLAGMCSVEATTSYLLPESARGVTQYIYSGRKATFVLRRYDDGWRVAR
jgi:hypothetical protein